MANVIEFELIDKAILKGSIEISKDAEINFLSFKGLSTTKFNSASPF